MNFIQAYEVLNGAGSFRGSEYDPDTAYCTDLCPASQQSLTRDIIGEVFPWSSGCRNPYFRLRGRPVTPEQAAEIIRRTASGPDEDTGEYPPDYIYPANLFGWCSPEGIVGKDGTMPKYPHAMELLDECYVLACEFPFLDLAVIITDLDALSEELFCTETLAPRPVPEHWLDRADIGILLHEGTFTMLHRETAVQTYRDYAARYAYTE